MLTFDRASKERHSRPISLIMLAALGVWGTATTWPDLLVAAIMAGLFLYSSVKIIDGFEFAAVDRDDAGVQEIEAAAYSDELLAYLSDGRCRGGNRRWS